MKQKTDGMIPQIIDTIDADTMMYLINALSFDAEWLRVYKDTDIHEKQKFTNANGTEQTVTMMFSEESAYLESEHATGFIKPYKDGYSFAAILPDETLSVDDYIASLNPESLSDMLNSAQNTEVFAKMPKFKSEYDISLVNALNSMGMQEAFSGTADFSGMSNTDLYISDVLHKTFIEVDERGTKAGAVTAVQMEENGAIAIPDLKIVTLDRPFVYMIIDDENHLPVFIGTVREMQN